MKLEEENREKAGCCKSQVDSTQDSGCCSSQSATTSHPSCCCSGEEDIDEPCCCGYQEPVSKTGCCAQPEANPYSDCCKSRDMVDDANQVYQGDVASLEQIQGLLMEANNKYMRLYAEFDNFKKRAVKERVALSDKANEQTIKEILPIVDDFDRCITSLQGTQDKGQHIEGIKLIYDKLNSLLKRYGVTEITIEPGTTFNADLHEAIMQQPVDKPEMQGKIVSVVEKGYLINTYVLRFAKVIIGV